MKPLQAHEIRGNWATLLLPIGPDDSINFVQLQTQIIRLIAFKVDGIYCCGTAGEFYNLTEKEFDHVAGLLARACEQAAMPFQIGVCHASPLLSLERLQRIVSLAPGAVQVILPDWSPTRPDESIAFLEKMAEAAAGIGLILYNPPHAKHVVTPEELADLCRAVPALIGIKSGGGDADWFRRMRMLLPDLALFVPGHTLASGMQKGASGAYSNIACLHPCAAQRWSELMRSDMKTALEWEKRIRLFLNECILPYIVRHGYSNQAADKFMAAVGGWTPITPRLRWPYASIPVTEIETQRQRGKHLLPEFLA
ncbi:dihydrodipicolinate synthase family protein [candidate division KSB1 bacterium]|nr:dihydrodipicolinate synthase family protein [candidate division KSB1 bacterium]